MLYMRCVLRFHISFSHNIPVALYFLLPPRGLHLLDPTTGCWVVTSGWYRAPALAGRGGQLSTVHAILGCLRSVAHCPPSSTPLPKISHYLLAIVHFISGTLLHIPCYFPADSHLAPTAISVACEPLIAVRCFGACGHFGNHPWVRARKIGPQIFISPCSNRHHAPVVARAGSCERV